MKRRDLLKGIGLGVAAAASPAWPLEENPQNDVREIRIKLQRYKFTPSVIKVREGERIRLVLEGLDLEHGFYIDGYDIDERVRHAESRTLEFTANKVGSFHIRCSVTCGPFHPFMTGRLIVEPVRRLPFAIGLSVLAPVIGFTIMLLREKKEGDEGG